VHSVLRSHLSQRSAVSGQRRAVAFGLATACALALALALAVPLYHDPPAKPWSPPGVALLGDQPLQSARCEQWLAAGQGERTRALDALHGVVGGPTPYGPATALTRAEAQRLFDRTCSNPIARNFLLYELYTRASGFRKLVEPNV
jgi:hypothetical protein